jgi:hypothetical protein
MFEIQIFLEERRRNAPAGRIFATGSGRHLTADGDPFSAAHELKRLIARELRVIFARRTRSENYQAKSNGSDLANGFPGR